MANAVAEQGSPLPRKLRSTLRAADKVTELLTQSN